MDGFIEHLCLGCFRGPRYAWPFFYCFVFFFALCLVLRCATAASDYEVGIAFFCCDEIFPYGWLWLRLWLRDGWNNEAREKWTDLCMYALGYSRNINLSL